MGICSGLNNRFGVEAEGMDRQLLLLLLILSSESAASASDDDTGRSFLIAFPENIAYYHPDPPANRVQITALHRDTSITITEHVTSSSIFRERTYTLSRGQSTEYLVDQEIELRKSQNSFCSVRIKSTKDIAVQAIHVKDNTVQTALVISTDKHGTEFFIPPVPTIANTTFPASIVTTLVTERNPFKVVIINGDQPNVVTMGEKDNIFEPFQVSQLWVDQGIPPQTLKANHPVAVLFGHPCAMIDKCTCGMLYTTLPPAKTMKLTYYIPPPLTIESQTYVLLSDEGTRRESSFNPDSPLITTSGSAILYRPGLLLTLIPETEFGTCFIVSTVQEATNFAVIMVDKYHTEGLHIEPSPLVSPDWEVVTGSQYVSAMLELTESQNLIWHETSTMAVYFVGNTSENKWFGHPAHVVSKLTDYRGCLLKPEVVEIGSEANSWRESLQYCKNRSLELVSFADLKLQRQIYRTLMKLNSAHLQMVWIGMRRSSMTGEWYWVNGDQVKATNWGEGEPGSVQEGQCAIVSLESNQDFGWRDEDCCKAVHPVCYKRPKWLSIVI